MMAAVGVLLHGLSLSLVALREKKDGLTAFLPALTVLRDGGRGLLGALRVLEDGMKVKEAAKRGL